MKNLIFVFIWVGFIFFTSCSSIQQSGVTNVSEEEGNTIKNMQSFPTPLPYSIAEKGINDTIYNSLARKCCFRKDANSSCENIPDSSYRKNGQYLYEMSGSRVLITPDTDRPTPPELKSGLLWVGTAEFTAEAFTIYDISNRKLLDSDEGTGLPNENGFIIKSAKVRLDYRKKSLPNANGQWSCDGCSKFDVAPTCEQIKQILLSIKK